MTIVRSVLVCVPVVVLLGFASGLTAQAGSGNRWYIALEKPEITPPDWVFPVAWTTLYVLMGVALATVVSARNSRGRGLAMGAFGIALAFNLSWTPVFFGAHRVALALGIIVAMLLTGIAATIVFGRIRSIAAWLMLPYLVWISFAGILNWRIDQMNPDARNLVPPEVATQING